ncbi:dTDP-4-dehydrorhamnose reductase [Paenibacillus sp. IB182496]|uniref:dTDP-4-dehydrorhamnose reductase n=1 Tax=Paenibacillus sabuli TaxID=2772509 RepID=A0A927BTB7_9BACL|nr:dTDP-4-dehydrorhamnose reductase [Paenibacillus sabuli]MBD2845917.1 dTDP-4-dehydrorhamnose reductase [Paenibacillus sabuli]
MSVLVTGAGGQLGRELALLPEQPGIEVVALTRAELDVTELEACRRVLAHHRPDAVLHCAAYTAVDRAEAEPEAAWRVNAAGTRHLALAAREHGAKLCYVSTDYVFDGSGSVPYDEYAGTNPQTVYGRTKLAGERLALTLHPRCFVVRTSWVYGRHGANFVNTMLQLAQTKDEVQVVRDQIGCPTYTRDLAVFLLELVQTEQYGIYHASNAGSCSWHEFAAAIFELSGSRTRALPCTTAEFPRPAPRPSYSVLGDLALRGSGLTPLRPWREALAAYLGELGEPGSSDEGAPSS